MSMTRGLMAEISIRIARATAAACALILFAACTGGIHQSGSSGTPGAAPEYTVGGTVSGLDGSGLVLASNTGETLTVSGNGPFTFKTTFPSGNPYYVLVLTQPGSPNQTCTATNGSGAVANTNVTSVTVVCNNKTAATDAIGGVVVGLTGSGLVLQNNGTDNLAVPSNGAFAFQTALPDGSQYDVSILSPPINPYEDCVVLNGKGTTADSDIASVAVACTVTTSPTHAIGGTVTGVSGTLVLEDNGRDDVTITADGPFKFPLPIPSGSSYSVTTKSAAGTQSQACTFTNATGIVGDGDVSNVTVVCKVNVSLQAAVSGLSGTGLVLRNTVDGENVTVSANGTSRFTTGIANGDSYNVTVIAQPTNPSQTCVVANGAGTASAGSTVSVTCTTNTYTVSGVVTGLPDPSSGANLNLVIQNNGGDNITIAPTANSPVAFAFATPVASGAGYSVTVLAQPGTNTNYATAGAVQTSTVCVVSGDTGAGTVTNGNITNVVVNCVRPLGFAYVTNSGDNTVSPYIIDIANGALLPSGPPVSTGNTPSATAPDSSNAFLYVTNSASSDLSGYAIDPNTGYLTPLSGSPFALGLSTPTSVATNYSNAGPQIYITNSGGQASAGGGLSGPGPVARSKVERARVSPAALAPTAGSISGFNVNTSGASFTDIVGSPFAAQVGPTAGLVFYGGFPGDNTYYFETDSGSNTVSEYLVDFYTGALSLVPNSPSGTGRAPSSVVGTQNYVPSLERDINNIFVANSGDGTISGYSMDIETGALTPLQNGNTTVGSGLNALAVAPCNCYLLASASQGVSVFSTDSSGALVSVGNGPFAAGAGPGPMAILYNYVYVVNTVDQTVSVFTQDSTTGVLTSIGGTLVKSGRTPSSIVVMPRPDFQPIG
jgi:Lactonase, 7-bladed beta-propeller